MYYMTDRELNLDKKLDDMQKNLDEKQKKWMKNRKNGCKVPNFG